jgi:hypothetical protein
MAPEGDGLAPRHPGEFSSELGVVSRLPGVCCRLSSVPSSGRQGLGEHLTLAAGAPCCRPRCLTLAALGWVSLRGRGEVTVGGGVVSATGA